MKKWNWTNALFVFVLALMADGSNQNGTVLQGLCLGLIMGIPISLLVAYLGRNEPCSCDSGKKYKNCCINKPQSA